MFAFGIAKPCECPLSKLSKDECNKYEIIFRGIIKTVKNCDGKYGEIDFEIKELYKGNATKNFKVLYVCKNECAQPLLVGDEWIIYTNYKQINNALLDWCSRSRKFIKVSKQDFYIATLGNDYDEEVKFLLEKLGLHRFVEATDNGATGRNKIPTLWQSAIILISSLVVLLLFYYLFNRFVK